MGVAHYLPQPPLPEVSGRGAGAMAGRTPGRTAAGSLFPRRVHIARADRRHRVPEQGRRLRDPVHGGGRGDDDARRRPAAARRQIGVVAVLHTWGQTLTHHPHVHCVVPGGGLSPGRRAGSRGRRTSFSPSSRSQNSSAAFSSNACKRPSTPAPRLLRRSRTSRRSRRVRRIPRPPMRRPDWVVYAKKPFGGPAQVLAYLGRYTHRVAIANSRLHDCDERSCQLSPGRIIATTTSPRP